MTADSAASALTGAEFADLMAVCGPFEDMPHIAIAVSGGADSMALALLAADWAASRRGTVTAITVDHGLRPESETEARQVGAWLKPLGIPHVILEWQGKKPNRGIMAAAREARYALLVQWCRQNKVLHLALAHHMEDQAATFLLRLKRGSGLEGLSAMQPVAEGFPRLLRPLLPAARARLRAALAARQQVWIDDPTNRNPAYDRNRIDAFLEGGNPIGLTPERVALAAQSLGRAKDALEIQIAAALARSVVLSHLGIARLKVKSLSSYPEDVRLRALSRVLLTVGGGLYPPRFDRLRRLWDTMAAGNLGKGKTLSGCLIKAHHDHVFILREAPAIAAPVLVSRRDFIWDNRFRLQIPEEFIESGVWIGRCTVDLWRRLKKAAPHAADEPIPAETRWTLPILWHQEDILAAPHYGFARPTLSEEPRIAFAPRHTLT